MRGIAGIAVLALVLLVLCGAGQALWAVQGSTEGQVVVVADGTLFVRTPTNEPMSFNPYFVLKNGAWVPAPPAATVFPALESGERVRVNWTLDEREGRRRVDTIELLSAKEGVSKGVATVVNPSTLVIKPKDEPGTVTLNVPYVQVEKRWVPDPKIVAKLSAIRLNTKVTVSWFWDAEGRKRVRDVIVGW